MSFLISFFSDLANFTAVPLRFHCDPQKEEGKPLPTHKGEGKAQNSEGKREKVECRFWVRIPLGNQTARMRARTKRHETISRLDSPITSHPTLPYLTLPYLTLPHPSPLDLTSLHLTILCVTGCFAPYLPSLTSTLLHFAFVESRRIEPLVCVCVFRNC